MNHDDVWAWQKYPDHHWTFNKLHVAEMCGYKCGPSGVPIPEDGKYIIRPIINLHGMSLDAYACNLKRNDIITPAGYFWCEFFEGSHVSVDYWAKDNFRQGLTVMGSKAKDSLYKFRNWTKMSLLDFPLDRWFNVSLFEGVDVVNVEYINGKPIEIHLRHNSDFENHDCDYLEVIWESDVENNPDWLKLYDTSWQWIDSRDTVPGKDIRLGFMGKRLTC